MPDSEYLFGLIVERPLFPLEAHRNGGLRQGSV